MTLRVVGRTILAGLVAVALLGLGAPAAFSDSHEAEIAKTVEEHQAAIKLLNSKSAVYRQHAADARAKAARFRNARDGKGRKIVTPEHREAIEKLEEMAQTADGLADDADGVAYYHQRKIEELQAAKES